MKDFYSVCEIENGRLEKYKGSDEKLIIPEGIIEIDTGAFEGCLTIKEIILSEGVRFIFDSAFEGCVNLKSIRLPTSLKEIGTGAFADCHSLESVVLPENVTFVGSFAFDNCRELKRVVIKGSNTYFSRRGSFLDCPKLTIVEYPADIRDNIRDQFWNGVKFVEK